MTRYPRRHGPASFPTMTLLRKIWLFAVAYVLRAFDYVTFFTSQSKRAIDATGVKVEHIRIPSRDEGRFIRAIRYTPVGVTGPLPVHLNWHASGWGMYKYLTISAEAPGS